jgi:hypothetical protein
LGGEFRDGWAQQALIEKKGGFQSSFHGPRKDRYFLTIDWFGWICTMIPGRSRMKKKPSGFID